MLAMKAQGTGFKPQILGKHKGSVCNPNTGRHRQIPEACWPASRAYMVSPRQVRDPVSKNKVGRA